MPGAAWVLQLSSDPAKSLIREGGNICTITSADQLNESCSQQLSGPPIMLGLDLMPLPAADGQKIVEFGCHR